MAYHQRKLLQLPAKGRDSCKRSCGPNYPPPPPPSVPNQNKYSSSIYLLMFCILAAAVAFVCYTLLKKYRSHPNNSSGSNTRISNETYEDLVDENHGPVVDHPIWLINTIGLQQSVIDSILMFKYKRNEGLIEGTECSVCLNEFQEDESLRLLPKCSHAFHIPCIDTWLRSHKNCPLCRAPIVCDSNNARVRTVEANLNESITREESSVENSGSYQVREDENIALRTGAENFGTMPTEEGKIAGRLEKSYRLLNASKSEVRVLSDLGDQSAKVEEELQPVRRSVSMDSASASMIYFAVSNIPPTEHEGCSDTRLVQATKPESRKVAKQGSRSNSSIYRVIKSSSFGRSSLKGAISMKRSYSSTGKRSQQRYSRSQDSILP